MAKAFSCSRFFISAKQLLNHNGIRRLLLPRCFIALEKRSCSQFLRQSPLLPLSRLSGPRQTLLCSFYSSAGIVKSEYTVEIPEISLNDFVLSKFSEYGDDIAMVSLRSGVYFHCVSVEEGRPRKRPVCGLAMRDFTYTRYQVSVVAVYTDG